MKGDGYLRIDPEQVRQHIAAQLNDPFQDLLAEFLECAPDPEAIHRAANESPDKYVHALGQLARLAGYSEKREPTTSVTNIYAQVNNLSDGELRHELGQLLAQLGSLPAGASAPAPTLAAVVEGELVPAEPDRARPAVTAAAFGAPTAAVPEEPRRPRE